MKNKMMRILVSLALCMAMIVSLVSCGSKGETGTDTEASSAPTEETSEDGGADLLFSSGNDSGGDTVTGSYTGAIFVRPALVDVSLFTTSVDDDVTAKVASYKVDEDLGNVMNGSDYADFAEGKQHLVDDGFYVQGASNCEFHEIYESDRYFYVPNFITVDSLMHAYHLYFAHMMKETEKEKLYDILGELTDRMLGLCKSQQEDMGLSSKSDAKTEAWKTASDRNIAFFAIAKALLDESYDPAKDKDIDKETLEIIEEELSLIEGAEGITASPLTGNEDAEDYSQYKPRGYYDTDENLKKYFKAMMWYGRRNFKQESETMDRSAMLMTLAMDDEAYEDWSTIYAVTSFFAGASDDNGVCEYQPLIEEAYGKSCKDIKGSAIIDDGAFDKFHEATGKLDPPEINSVPMEDDGGETDKAAANEGFRFMGQRFSIDAAIFQKLIYSNVGQNKNGDKRMLPEALDIPAAFGNKTAEDILTNDLKAKEYQDYAKNLSELQSRIENSSDDSWYTSLYSEWLNTLRPLLEEKGSGYPMFMQSDGWKYKALESFLGSYTELKHDTILYSKQVIAEAGGDDPAEKDDRGYVEPEVKVYKRFVELAEGTSTGLEKFGLLTDTAKTDLERLKFLAESFEEISKKELKDETLTDDEYELIRSYGAELEHFWEEANKDEVDNDYDGYGIATNMFPAALVVDVATNPEGSVLELGTGRVSTIYVVVPVDGTLRIAKGGVYDFYQFEQPINERLTDHEWRVMLGIDPDDNGDYHWEGDEMPDKPEWTKKYRVNLD